MTDSLLIKRKRNRRSLPTCWPPPFIWTYIFSVLQSSKLICPTIEWNRVIIHCATVSVNVPCTCLLRVSLPRFYSGSSSSIARPISIVFFSLFFNDYRNRRMCFGQNNCFVPFDDGDRGYAPYATTNRIVAIRPDWVSVLFFFFYLHANKKTT